VKKYKNAAGESSFDKISIYLLSCLAFPISNADGTDFSIVTSTKTSNVKESNQA